MQINLKSGSTCKSQTINAVTPSFNLFQVEHTLLHWKRKVKTIMENEMKKEITSKITSSIQK